MNHVEAVAAVLEAQPDALYVSSLGTPTSALRAASDDGPHLYLGGSMGIALAVALGVAEQRPDRRVIALLGDGEAVMGAGSFWSLAGLAPANLTAVVLADGLYSITGGQALGVPGSFCAVASALGLRAAVAGDLAELLADRVSLIEVPISDSPWPRPSPFVDPPVVRARFSANVNVKSAGKGGGLP